MLLCQSVFEKMKDNNDKLNTILIPPKDKRKEYIMLIILPKTYTTCYKKSVFNTIYALYNFY